MIEMLSLPLFIMASVSFILSLFFVLLFYRLKYRYKESVTYFLIFALSALIGGIFFSAFGILLNSSDNLNNLNVANRITVIGAMFTIVLSLHFYIAFFRYKAPVFLKWCYYICALFSLMTLVPNKYFLKKAFYSTSEYYVGLEYGPLFQAWGLWILVLAMYCIYILVKVYARQRKRHKNRNISAVQLLLFANVIWMITGVCDTFTGIQLIDFPPLTWIGSFLVTCSIAWILVLHIDKLYEEKMHLTDRLMFDHLTQAFSRKYLEIKLAEEINRLTTNESSALTICVFDIDDFKSINDHYGHVNGDELLKQITELIKESIGPSDCIARLGGDEFVILLADSQGESNDHMTIERIRKRIEQTKFGASPSSFDATCSFGIVCVKAGVEDSPDLAEQLLSRADEALYNAKRQGKNTIGIYQASAGELI